MKSYESVKRTTRLDRRTRPFKAFFHSEKPLSTFTKSSTIWIISLRMMSLSLQARKNWFISSKTRLKRPLCFRRPLGRLICHKQNSQEKLLSGYYQLNLKNLQSESTETSKQAGNSRLKCSKARLKRILFLQNRSLFSQIRTIRLDASIPRRNSNLFRTFIIIPTFLFDSIFSAVCRKKDLIILSDEIYARCFTNGGSNLSIAKFYPEGTLVCSGIAKWCGGGGWRVGYVMFPKELRPLYDAVIREGGQTYATVAEPIQVFSCIGFADLGISILYFLVGISEAVQVWRGNAELQQAFPKNSRSGRRLCS